MYINRSIRISPEFEEVIQAYADQQNVTWAEAARKLMAIALYVETGQHPPQYAKTWGGERREGWEHPSRGLSEDDVDRLNSRVTRGE